MGRRIPSRHDSSFGAWLEREIKRAGMNQREFAEKAGVGTSTVSRWVNGRVPPYDYVERIADALVLDRDDVAVRAGYRDSLDRARDDRRSRLISKLKRVELNEERARYLTVLLDDMGRNPLREEGTRMREG